MRTSVRLKLDAARRVSAFLVLHPMTGPAGTDPNGRLGTLLDLADRIRQQLGLARAAIEAARAERERLALSVREQLAHLARLAAVAAAEEPGSDLCLVVRFAARKTRLHAQAREAVAEAEAHRALLERFGMPSWLPAELRAALDRHDDTVRREATTLAAVVAADAELEEVAREAFRVIRHLDALNRLRLASDPARLAEWHAARAVRWPRGPAAGDRRRHSGEAEVAQRRYEATLPGLAVRERVDGTDVPARVPRRG